MSSTTPPDRARLQRLLGGPALADLRQRLRRRYANTPVPADGFTLSRIGPAERESLAGLLGRARQPAASMRLSHKEIDMALRRAQLAPDLRSALEVLDGPIIDRAAEQAREQAAWSKVFEQAPNSGLAGDTGFQALAKRLSGGDPRTAAVLLADVTRVLAALPTAGISRSRLAAQTLGDAHGLDNNRPVATLLRRVLDPARAMARMRDVWATQGILVNELAKPVAVLNIQTQGNGATDRLLQSARAAGEPLHLSLRSLLRHTPAWTPGQQIFVCENPDVLTAAADRFGHACPPMIELGGQLSAAPRTLLDQLHAAGCRFRYHGDFDWPGLRIANGVIARYGARPWRYAAADYQPDTGPRLGDGPVDAIWDVALTAKMQQMDVAVHEEAQLELLLEDLQGAVYTSGGSCS